MSLNLPNVDDELRKLAELIELTDKQFLRVAPFLRVGSNPKFAVFVLLYYKTQAFMQILLRQMIEEVLLK